MSKHHHSLGILISDRWDLTEKTLLSLYYSDQSTDTYDLFLIDNGSSQRNLNSLKEWASTSLLPIKNLISLRKMSIPQAWNIFLMLSQDYSFRTMMDNDIVLYNTPVGLEPPAADVSTGTSVGYAGVNPGAVPVVSIRNTGDFFTPAARPVAGAKEARKGLSSTFLDHLQSNADEMDAGIVALVPVVPKVPFMNALENAAQARYRGRPYLLGGCTMITHEGFKKLGYLDERLTRHVDVQYSQRALLQRINISYHPSYWAFHTGHDKNTFDENDYELEGRKSRQIMDSEPLTELYVDSAWNAIFPKVRKAADRNQIVNLT